MASRFESIDVLVNNAGITADELLLMTSEKNWDTLVNTSLKGIFIITKRVLKCMLRKKSGSCRKH
ncbi:SDR family NAD(P)-dependent oxidoreductase [Desulfococcaceae bacterium HSG9]|nr:SDR family NAD(P)-dependent oxidoreductase [Desulfococcaceae bacterium HSG9]